jgi:probable blue pigment (indigoidine) exporter
MTLSSVGYVLTKKWGAEVSVLALTSWQLIAGGLVLIPFALAFEGVPPHMDSRVLFGYSYATLIATALAYLAWFTGLRHLRAGAVGLIGLLNPLTGVLVGTFIASETLGARQFTGTALVLFGVVLGQSHRRNTETPARD